MNILAIETSSPLLSVAVRRHDGVTAEINLEGGLHHAESLIHLVAQALEILHLKKKDLSVIACGVGPGSFTGLRIGLSAVKGLALGLKKKVVGISSLDLIAEGAVLATRQLAVICDARRERIYSAIYQFHEGVPRKVVKDSLFSFDQLIKKVGHDTVFVGNAIPIYGNMIQKTLGRKTSFLKEFFWKPKASSIFLWLDHQKGKFPFVRLNRLEPAYLRLSEAEERRKVRA